MSEFSKLSNDEKRKRMIDLINEDNKFRLFEIMKNEDAALLPEYEIFFSDKYSRWKETIASNSNATRFKEYENFFDEEDKWIRKKIQKIISRF